jgi:short-subunit dehydrogenase
MSRPVALVTGASAGIGTVFAQRLAADGYDLVLVARDRERLEKLAAELPTDVEVLAADLTDAADLARVEARCAAGLDVLVNNAGFGTAGDFAELDVDGEEREIRLNVLALMRLTHAAVGPMVARGSGGILNVSSLAGYQPGPWNATYAATKAFVSSFTQAVHEEVKGKGVTVTLLCPGFTRTEFQERAGLRREGGPAFLWQGPEPVVDTGLRALRRRSAVAVPGWHNRVAAVFSQVVPQSFSRQVSKAIMRRAK